MIGKGAAMRAIFDKVAKTAPSSGRVLITGENGTGKELSRARSTSTASVPMGRSSSSIVRRSRAS